MPQPSQNDSPDPAAEPVRALWLAANKTSGSTSEEALAALHRAFAAAGITVERTIFFPDEPLPTAADLDAAGIDCIAVSGGDGTVNALVTGLYGWSGAVLVLPGGTMNLLSKELHGNVTAPAVIAALPRARRVRAPVVRTDDFASRVPDAFGGAMIGPGTAWNHVREALRDIDLARFISGAASAITESTAGPMVVCDGIPGARAEGYSLVVLTPAPDGFIVEGYYAQSVSDYARQGIALLRRDFREGPHDDLGTHATITLRSPQGGAMGLLIDGEPSDGASTMSFHLAQAEVDLLATRAG